MRTIPVLPDHWAMVDNEDYEAVSAYTWRIDSKKSPRFAVTNSRSAEGRQTTVSMHRMIVGATGKEYVMHKNGKTLDNRKSNLIVLKSHPNKGKLLGPTERKYAGKTSQYRGVTKFPGKLSAPWRAGMRANGKHVHIGMFATETEAAQAYNRFAIKHLGDKAILNHV